MESSARVTSPSKAQLWTGWVLTALPALLLMFSGVMKVIRHPSVVQGFAHFGLPDQLMVALGILEFSCAVICLVPQVSVIGAILMTGYLGGAILTNLRVGESVIAPAVLGVLAWGGLFLRDPRIRALIPLRS
jgi:DoxX-like family